MTSKKEKEIAGLQAAYEIEKKQYTISLLEKDNEIKEQQLSRERIFTYASLIALLILSMLVLYLYRRQYRTQGHQSASGKAPSGNQPA